MPHSAEPAHTSLGNQLDAWFPNHDANNDVLIKKVLSLLDVKEATSKVYKSGLRDFLEWNNGRSLNASTTTRYKQHLVDRVDMKVGTKNLYLTASRILVTQMHRVGILDRDYGRGVRGFVIAREHQKGTITDKQVAKVFSYIDKKKDKRLTLIFTLLYFQGLRQREMVTARIENFDNAKRTLMIEGKTRDDKERIDLHPRTVEVIQRFLELSRLTSGYFLYSKRTVSGYMSLIQLGRIIRAVHDECGIANSGHAWRKVFTSKLIASGLDLVTVSSLTRHKSIAMLQVYYDSMERKKKLPLYYDVFEKKE